MRRPIALFAAALTLSATTVQAFDVTMCNQTVPAHETGVLQVDLVCDGNHGPDVNLSLNARLELNGHTISGGYLGIATSPGHVGRNEIVGPGEIFGVVSDGSGDFGAAIGASGKVVVRNVTLRDNLRGILSIYDFAMKLEDVTITNNAAAGISSYFVNVGSLPGPGKGQISARNSVVSGNGGNGIEAYGILDLRDTIVSGNGEAGIVSNGRKFTLRNSTVTANVGSGIVSTFRKPGKLKETSATGNGPGGDIVAPVAPKLVASTCDHSVDTDGGTLGICTGD